MKAFPKIFALGTRNVESIFDTEVQVTEKVDGSQFGFCKTSQGLQMRSKGATLYEETPESHMFYKAVQRILQVQDVLCEDYVYYGEYLQKPKHNSLTYSEVPQGNIALFGIQNVVTGKFLFHDEVQEEANILGLDTVPLIFQGKTTAEAVMQMLDRESFLGNAKIEGVVVRADKEHFVGGELLPIMSAKFVSEEFKEVHRKEWGAGTSRGGWAEFVEGYKTEPRWKKAVERARDAGTLLVEPKDIGPLIKSIQQDIVEDEKAEIMAFLWKSFSPELLRRSTAGFAEWYKEELAKGTFNG